jgi:hypothetical protein
VVGDRNFLSHADLTAILATGAHAVFRVKAGAGHFEYTVAGDPDHPLGAGAAVPGDDSLGDDRQHVPTVDG